MRRPVEEMKVHSSHDSHLLVVAGSLHAPALWVTLGHVTVICLLAWPFPLRPRSSTYTMRIPWSWFYMLSFSTLGWTHYTSNIQLSFKICLPYTSKLLKLNSSKINAFTYHFMNSRTKTFNFFDYYILFFWIIMSNRDKEKFMLIVIIVSDERQSRVPVPRPGTRQSCWRLTTKQSQDDEHDELIRNSNLYSRIPHASRLLVALSLVVIAYLPECFDCFA
jgi:hypothetical protein